MRVSIFLISIIIVLIACQEQSVMEDQAYKYRTPSFFPKPTIPQDNQATTARIELGRRLFFEKKLSRTESMSCATCHVPSMAFTDGKARSTGAHGKLGKRNAPTLANLLWMPYFMAEGGVPTLELQALAPLQDSIEMDMSMRDAIHRLEKIEKYQNLSQTAYNRPIDSYVIIRALAAYQRTFISADSRFDKWYYQQETKAFTAEEELGKKIFFSEKAACMKCHSIPQFTDYQFYNIGLYENYADAGKELVTYKKSDNGKFKTPTLRNIELTPPYMHDGSMRTLEEVIEFYNTGGKNHPNKDFRIQPMNWTKEEKGYLLAFLKTLTDWNFVQNHTFLPLEQ